jgi:WD40 repeat protein
VWDASTGKEVLRVRSGYASAVAFSPDGKRLAAGTDDGGLGVWDATDGKEVFTADHAHARRVVYVAFAGGGKYLVSAGQRKHQQGLFEPWPPDYDGEVKVWDAATGKEQFAFRTDAAGVNGACLDPDGLRIAASPGASREPVKIWSLAGDE